MLLIKTDTLEYPITIHQFKRRVNVSWGSEITPEPYGYAFVTQVPMPAFTRFQKVIEIAPKVVDGKWTQQWQVIDLEGEELSHAQACVAAEAAKAQWLAAKTD
ncbi:hypothetical protein LDC_1179, partial [sediment metagenome]